MTFQDPAVREELAGYALVKVDVDQQETNAVRERWFANDGVPEIVLISPDGQELHRIGGALPPEPFLAELRRARDASSAAVAEALEQHAKLAEFWSTRGEHQHVENQLAAIRRLDPRHESGRLEQATWRWCEALQAQRQWPALAAAARGYLQELPNGEHAADVRVLLGVAEFETSGTMSEALRERITALRAVCAKEAPGGGVGGRLARLLGGRPDENELQTWVRELREAMHELLRIGSAARDDLHADLVGTNPAAARHAASVLGRMRLPETAEFLLARLRDPELPAYTKPHVAQCLGMLRDPRALEPLVAIVQSSHEAPAVRVEAGYAVRMLVTVTGAKARQDVADAMAAAVESSNAPLRGEALQGLLCVEARVPLPPLLHALSDRRELFGEYRICDNALWVLLRQLGMGLVDGSGAEVGATCTPEVAAFLREWYAGVADRLRWDEASRRYVVADRGH